MPGLKVMIVDPHSCFSRAATNFLLAGGKVAAVETASCVLGALEEVSYFKPDLLLLDALLLSEESSGTDLLSKIRQKLPEAKLIIMSLYSRGNNPGSHPGYKHKHVYKWVSKQDFAAELLVLLNGYLTESG